MKSRRRCHREIRRFHFDADMWLGRFFRMPVRTHLSFPFIVSRLQVTEAFPQVYRLKLDRPMSATCSETRSATTPTRNGLTKAAARPTDENLICALLNLKLSQTNPGD